MLIIYGSLYPWHFVHRELAANPLWILLHSWEIAPGRRFVADFVVNIALYVPLGMAGYLALRKHRILGPVALGAVLSASIEMVQLFVPGRVCSAVDLTNNVVGAGLGVVCGNWFELLARPKLKGITRRRAGDRPALALLFCRVGAMLFPLFPVTSLVAYRNELARFVSGPWLEVVPLASGAAAWFVSGRLLVAAGVINAEFWLGCSMVLAPAQFLIVGRQPMPTDFLAAAAGLLLFLWFGRRSGMEKALAGGFIALLVLRGLAPFHFTTAQPFTWVPFGGLLKTDWQSGIGTLLEKAFDYGTAIWLMHAAGVRWRSAIAAVAAVLGAIEVTQIWLPGRTPEITDPVLAVLVGLGLTGLGRRKLRRTAEPA